MMVPRPGRRSLGLFALAGLCGLAGCSGPKAPIVLTTFPATKLAPAEGKIEVDAALTAAGLEFQEKSRDAQRIAIVVRSPKQDHESSVYSYTLFDASGGRLSSTGISVPGFKKGESSELEIQNDDLPKASRIVFGPFGK